MFAEVDCPEQMIHYVLFPFKILMERSKLRFSPIGFNRGEKNKVKGTFTFSSCVLKISSLWTGVLKLVNAQIKT